MTSTPSRLPYSAQAAIVVAAVLMAVGAPVAVGFALYGGHHRASLSGAANVVAPSGVTVVYPAVSGISPASGSSAGGTLVTITGTGLSGATRVSFGGAAATITPGSDSATQLSVISPPGAGEVHIRVTTEAGSVTSAGIFTYVSSVSTASPATRPVVTRVSPADGSTAGGIEVTVTGTGLSGATGVTFGAAPGLITADSATQLMVKSPAAAGPGPVNVTVTTSAGTSARTAADKFTYRAYVAPLPTVTGIFPATGSSAGGTLVTITGTGLSGAAGVSFGGVAATITPGSDSATQLSVTTPPGVGAVQISVTTEAGSVTSAGIFTYVSSVSTTSPTSPPSRPLVTGVSPAGGSTAGGTEVTVTGTGLSGATGVSFGSASGLITADSAGKLTVKSPAVAGAGPVDVTVTTSAGTSASTAADKFTYRAYVAPLPTVTGVSPASGSSAGGTLVTITGTVLSGATGVSFGGVAATGVTVVSGTQITAISPAGPAGLVDVTVTTAAGTSLPVAADEFTYRVPRPTVTGISPASGSTAGGALVTITGTGFTGATAVSFGSAAASSFNVVSGTQITAISPAGPAGLVDVTVTTAAGASPPVPADEFTYVAPAPAVTGVSPDTGTTEGGALVTITGTGLSGATGVSFGGVAATAVTVVSDTEITAISPAGPAGLVDVTVTTAAGASPPVPADEFTYVAPAPAVTGVSPDTGTTEGGALVTITGTGFTDATAVSFGSAAASSFNVVSGTQITATSPAGPAGLVDVTVTTAAGTSVVTEADEFTYLAPAPAVTGVSPDSGSPAGGTLVTITGTGLSGATGVSFGGAAATAVTVVSDTEITAISPADDSPDEPDTVDVTVTTPNGTSAVTDADAFTYALSGGE